MTSLRHWLVCACTLWALASCGAQVTEDDVGASQVGAQSQALCGSGGYWHGLVKRKVKYHSVHARAGKQAPPTHRDELQCARLEYECGKHYIGTEGQNHHGRGEEIDCGECGEGADCELGQCVEDCVPDGSETVACSDNGESLDVFDSCGTLTSTTVCDYGCENAMCRLPVCGDGIVQPEVGEECDDGNVVATDDCTATCQDAVCGDGIVQADVEECDDGNTVDTDACTAACQDAVCGDGIVQTDAEACDDGNGDDLDACSNNCTEAVCGDGIIQAGEACDDGNQNDTDLCLTTCVAASCGDGILQPGSGEACDDGAFGNSPFGPCFLDCTVQTCGDGVLQFPEVCDDGNDVETDSCTTLCKPPACGDGFVQGNEQCDDGNMVNTDDCTNSCRLPACGDHVVNGDEECDDGNPNNTDGCTNVCLLAACGDGYLQPSNGEVCDDGNEVLGDGCDNACQEEEGKVFVTSAVYTGNLGGVEGADAICQAHATAAGLPGEFRAWIGLSGVSSPATSFSTWPGKIVLTDGTVIADSWSDFTDGMLDAAIMLDENGNPAPASTTWECGQATFIDTLVWSGAVANGNWQIVTYCDGWTSTDGGGHTGDRSSMTGTWSQWCFPPCSIEAPLYCVQQAI